MTVQGIKNRIRRDIRHWKTLKGKCLWEFIWDYYKIPIISLVLLFTLSGMFSMCRGDIAMYTILVNANEQTQSNVFDGLVTDAGIDLGDRTVSVTANYKLGGEFSEFYGVEIMKGCVLAAVCILPSLPQIWTGRFAGSEPRASPSVKKLRREMRKAITARYISNRESVDLPFIR